MLPPPPVIGDFCLVSIFRTNHVAGRDYPYVVMDALLSIRCVCVQKLVQKQTVNEVGKGSHAAECRQKQTQDFFQARRCRIKLCHGDTEAKLPALALRCPAKDPPHGASTHTGHF